MTSARSVAGAARFSRLVFRHRRRDLRGLEVLAPRRAAAAVPHARYTSSAVAVGWAIAAPLPALEGRGRRGRAGHRGLNGIGLVPWLRARAARAGARPDVPRYPGAAGRAHRICGLLDRPQVHVPLRRRGHPLRRAGPRRLVGPPGPGRDRADDRAGRAGCRSRPRAGRWKPVCGPSAPLSSGPTSIGQVVYHPLLPPPKPGGSGGFRRGIRRAAAGPAGSHGMNRGLSEPERVTEVETTDSTAVALSERGPGLRDGEPAIRSYTIEYL